MNKSLESLSDEKLITLSRGGNEKATDILFNRYKGLIIKNTNAYFAPGNDRDDIFQEGLIGFYKALLDFSPKENVSFATFASLCIKRRLINAIKAANGKKHGPLNTSIPITTLEKTDLDSFQNPEEIYLTNEKAKNLNKKMKDVLSPFEKQVFDLLINGKSYIDIANELKKTPKSVDNAIFRIKKKLSLNFSK